MEDDPREVLTAALDPFVPCRSFRFIKSNDQLADAALAALEQAGYRLVRADDLRWMVDSLEHVDSAYLPRGDEIPPGVRVLLDEMEGE